MDYPNIPTDNLYKFLAIGGLVVFIFSIVYPTGKLLELEFQLADFKAGREKINIERNFLNKEIEILEKKESVGSNEIKVIRDKLLQQELKEADFNAQAEKIQVSFKWIQDFQWLAIIGSLLGVILEAIGFTAWYLRVQHPQDQLLEKQLAESNKKYNN
jgi:hypothetical protein